MVSERNINFVHSDRQAGLIRGPLFHVLPHFSQHIAAEEQPIDKGDRDCQVFELPGRPTLVFFWVTPEHVSYPSFVSIVYTELAPRILPNVGSGGGYFNHIDFTGDS